MNRRDMILAMLGTGAALCRPLPLRAHENHAPAPVGGLGKTRVKLADVELTDQQRRRGRLPRDFVAGRIVVANFVFTTCGSVCPVISAIFAQLQQQLPADLARDTVMLSLSVDPLNDTPDRLDAKAKQYGSGANWRWLTGRVEDMEAALKGFGAYTSRPDDHLPMAVVGDPASDTWYRFTGTPGVQQLLRTVQQLQQQRHATRKKS
jgi:protein SCO1/2